MVRLKFQLATGYPINREIIIGQQDACVGQLKVYRTVLSFLLARIVAININITQLRIADSMGTTIIVVETD